jgi:hypothetical protein
MFVEPTRNEAGDIIPTKFPVYMTGKLFREKLGLNTKPEKGFKVRGKFKRIPWDKRIAFLKNQIKIHTAKLPLYELKKYRNNFDAHKFKNFPISENSFCYCCIDKAEIRHHVIPLSCGGRNKHNNIVLLCNNCHTKVHPHLRRKKKKVGGSFSALRNSEPINGPIVVSKETVAKTARCA